MADQEIRYKETTIDRGLFTHLLFMRQSTLVFVFNEKNQILLAMKKRGFGVGKWNGAGGKVESGETLVAAAVREVLEETAIQLAPENLVSSALLHFYFSDHPEWNQDVSVFLIHNYSGAFVETDEMRPQWFSLDEIPYHDMWEDDIYWLPRVIDGEKVEFEFYF